MTGLERAELLTILQHALPGDRDDQRLRYRWEPHDERGAVLGHGRIVADRVLTLLQQREGVRALRPLVSDDTARNRSTEVPGDGPDTRTDTLLCAG